MDIRLTHIDGKLPNLALMKLCHWYRAKGDQVYLERSPNPGLFEPSYDLVYGSSIFQWSKPVIERLREAYPEAQIGGTGTEFMGWDVESVICETEYEYYDYSIYPEYPFSLGFTQRGCRLNCGFCVVPKKEGKPRSVNTLVDIYRVGTPKCVVLLDNDFFGQPENQWRGRIEEIRDGDYKVSFNQGINIRMITPESAHAIASIRYYDDQFKTRRIYTAWDNLGQESVFFKGFNALVEAGVKPRHVMVYMLVGYKPGETMEEILYRFHKLKDAGCLPYPMVYDSTNKLLKRFQRWAIWRYHQFINWEDYQKELKLHD